MYKAAAEQINKGLSPVARLLLGFVSALFGSVIILLAATSDKSVASFGFGIFCLLITVTCITRGRIRQFVGGVIGCALFALSAWYLYSEITGGPFLSGRRSEPSVVNAIFAFVAFGLPGIAYAIKTRFGLGQSGITGAEG